MMTHTENIELYLSSGGDPRLAKLHRTSTLQNRSRIVYLLAKLDKAAVLIQAEMPVEPEPPAALSPEQAERPKFIGEIVKYPVELHHTYIETEKLWFQYCSLKLELNQVPAADEKKSLEIQNMIIDLFKKFDACKKILDHYLEHKHILPTESKKDFDGLTDLQLDLERRNLESLICRRKQTIVKMEKQLPEDTDPLYNKRVSAVNNKKEQLQLITLDHEKIIELLRN